MILRLSTVVVFCNLFFYTVAWSTINNEVTIDTTIRDLVYNGQEKLQYDISWTGGIKIGELSLEIRDNAQDDTTNTIHARVKDSGFFHMIYPVNDTFDTVVSGNKRLPVSYDVEQKEGSSYHALRHTEYDQQNGMVTYRKNNKQVETFEVEGEVHNEFSSFFYTRILQLAKDTSVLVPTFADKKRHNVVVTIDDRKTIKNELLGTVNVVQVTPVLDFKGLYDKSGDTVIYYSDDNCRVPVRINSKILVGSITAELVSYRSSTCLQYSTHHPEPLVKAE